MKKDGIVFFKIGIVVKIISIYLLYNALREPAGKEQTIYLLSSVGAWFISGGLNNTEQISG